MRKILLLLMSVAVLLSSCSQSPVYDDLLEQLDTTITYVIDGKETVVKAAVSAPLSEDPAKEGYVFVGWSLDEGGSQMYTAWGEVLEGDLRLYAVLEYDETAGYLVVSPSGDDGTGAGTMAAPYKTISKAVSESEGSASVLVVGTVTEDITLTDGYDLELHGYVGQGSEEEAALKGRIVMAEDSSLTLEDIVLTNDSGAVNSTGGMGLVFSSTGGFDVKVVNSRIVPIGQAYGIEVSLLGNGVDTSPVSVELRNSVIDLSDSDVGTAYARGGSYGRAVGIAVNNKYDDTRGVVDYAYLDSFTLVMSGSEIIGNTDPGISTINILLNEINQIDLDITGSSITTPRNHYPILMNDCGSEDRDSHVTISDSYIKAWCGLYIRNGSAGIDVDVSGTTFDCISDNAGESNAFSCFSIHSSFDCSIDVGNCHLILGGTEDAANMAVFCYQYNNTYGGASSFSFSDCTFEYIGGFDLVDGYIGSIDHLDGELDNSFTMDEASLAIVLSLVDGSQIAEHHEDYTVAGGFTVDYTTYYLTVPGGDADTSTV